MEYEDRKFVGDIYSFIMLEFWVVSLLSVVSNYDCFQNIFNRPNVVS